jgi:hypothetical protein
MPRTHQPYPSEYRRRLIELARAGRSISVKTQVYGTYTTAGGSASISTNTSPARSHRVDLHRERALQSDDDLLYGLAVRLCLSRDRPVSRH